MNLLSISPCLLPRHCFSRLVILLLLCTGFGRSANAQHYIPFPDSLAAWKMLKYGTDPGGFAFSYTTYNFQKGDTIIGNTVYHKLYGSGNQVYNTSSLYAGYKGGLRETADRKIYFLSKNASVETLLYDFNWQPGDTVGLECSDAPSTWVLVAGADSVLLNDGKYHRQLLLQKNGNPANWTIIEGIGSSTGLFTPTCSFDVFEFANYRLNCFMKDSLLVYTQNVPGYTCNFQIILDHSESLQVQTGVLFTPTVLSLTGLFQTVDPSILIKEINIQDALGRLVYHQDNLNQNRFELQRSGLAPGLHTYRVLDYEGTWHTGKLLVE